MHQFSPTASLPTRHHPDRYQWETVTTAGRVCSGTVVIGWKANLTLFVLDLFGILPRESGSCLQRCCSLLSRILLPARVSASLEGDA